MTQDEIDFRIQRAGFRRLHWETCGIYAIIHRDTGRSYVGSAVKMGRRWANHVSQSRGDGTERIHKALREFGERTFDFVVLETCESSELLEREKIWIEKMGSASADGFNTIKNPAERHMGRLHSDATKQRMSAHRKGRKHSQAHRAALTASLRRPEHRALLSLKNTGKRRTPEQRAKMGVSRRGKKLSEEHRKKLSISHKGKKPSDESRAKLSASLKGRQFSPEHRLALSEASKRRYANPQPAQQAA
jgi:group I intron endonuclease